MWNGEERKALRSSTRVPKKPIGSETNVMVTKVELGVKRGRNSAKCALKTSLPETPKTNKHVNQVKHCCCHNH